MVQFQPEPGAFLYEDRPDYAKFRLELTVLDCVYQDQVVNLSKNCLNIAEVIYKDHFWVSVYR